MKKSPLTGEPRKTRQPFFINTLPRPTRERIRELRAEGKTWKEIEELSPTFSPKRLPHSTLQRWFDVNVEQKEKLDVPDGRAADEERLASLIAAKVAELLKPFLPGGAA